MNEVIKAFTLFWLVVTLFVSWLGCAIIGFFFAFSQYPWVKSVTPMIGITIVICIIKCMGIVINSDPIAYFTAKYKWLESKFVKETV